MDHLPMPKFGPLAGLRVVFSVSKSPDRLPGKCSQNGARKLSGSRTSPGPTPFAFNRTTRNSPAAMLSLNIFKDEGREAFLKLMETTDIFIEASKGPAFARRGITDEILRQHNPTGYRSPVRFWSVRH